jgi:hypothetical protein
MIEQNYETIIVGAGPAGLQLGYFLERERRFYIILEKDNIGSFFRKYPISRKLISINKIHTGSEDPEFNLRHDWNSLLGESPQFKNYDSNYYPNAENLVKYLEDYATFHHLKIKNKTPVLNIRKNEDTYILETNETIYTCKKCIIATGLSQKVYPNVTLKIKDPIPHYSDCLNIDLCKLINKRVCIIGGGNSSYELANMLNEYTATTIIIGAPLNIASVTHYSGNVRSIYLPFLDTFLLKSLNGIDTTTRDIFNSNTIEQIGNKYFLKVKEVDLYNGILNRGFDQIFFCTGWKFDDSIFNFPVNTTIRGKYPDISSKYESTNNKNLFFIGSLMHSRDYRKSSGGFIHGFRYLISNFYNLHYSAREYEYFSDVISVSFHVHSRISKSSSLYQMFGVLYDVIYIENDHMVYLKDINNFEEFKGIPIVAICLNFGERDEMISKIGAFNKFNPHFLHPEILYILDGKLLDLIRLDEQIIGDFSDVIYRDKIYRILSGFLGA